MMQTHKKMRQGILLSLLLLFNCHFCMAQFAGNQSFDGTSQAVGTPTAMLNGATVFTIEFWVKTTESRSNSTYWQRPTLLGNATNGNYSSDFGIVTDNGFIGMWSGLNAGNDNSFLSATVQINDNNWHHIAAVNDGSNINLFVDGNTVGSIASGLGLGTNNAPLTIAGSALDFSFTGNVGPDNFFHQGVFDEVRFSNNVRYTTNFTVPAAAFASDANTVALYHFDNGCVSGKVPDASANANNGRPYNLTGNCAFTLPPVPTIPVNSAATNINKAEYFYDADPGFGSGSNLSVTASTDVTGNYTLPLPSANGVHRVYLRTQNASKSWSLTNMSSFYIVPASFILPGTAAAVNINKAEYFFDTDPGFGNGTNLAVTAALDVSATYSINLQSLTTGVHRIYFRTRNVSGVWSLTNVTTFYIVPASIVLPATAAPASIVKAEYFLDTDPGFGSGVNIPIGTSGTDITANNVFVNISSLNNGVHRVYVRTQDANGKWSLTNNNYFSILAASFSLPPNPVAGNITKLEYFFDSDPGFGKANTINIAPTTDLNNYVFNADVTGLNDGSHTLFVRTFDDWGMTSSKTFIKGAVLPLSWLSFTAKAATDSVLLNWQTTNEINTNYFTVQRSIDGNNFTDIGKVTANNIQTAINNYSFTDKNPLQGISYYRIKQIDKDGKYSYSVVIAIKYSHANNLITILPNPFRDAFSVNINAAEKSAASLTVIDLQGKIIVTKEVNLQTGVNNFKLDGLGNLASGNYLLRIVTKEQTTTNKLIKQ